MEVGCRLDEKIAKTYTKNSESLHAFSDTSRLVFVCGEQRKFLAYGTPAFVAVGVDTPCGAFFQDTESTLGISEAMLQVICSISITNDPLYPLFSKGNVTSQLFYY